MDPLIKWNLKTKLRNMEKLLFIEIRHGSGHNFLDPVRTLKNLRKPGPGPGTMAHPKLKSGHKKASFVLIYDPFLILFIVCLIIFLLEEDSSVKGQMRKQLNELK